jgi:hypothetical protein
MVMKLRNMTKKITSVIAIIAVSALNFSAVVQCGMMLVNDDCCHITNSVKPCCIKNQKIIFDERITGHCGCSVNGSRQPVDLYADFTSSQYKNFSHSSIDFEFTNSTLLMSHGDIRSENYSPPIICGNDTYLANMNLRI